MLLLHCSLAAQYTKLNADLRTFDRTRTSCHLALEDRRVGWILYLFCGRVRRLLVGNSSGCLPIHRDWGPSGHNMCREPHARMKDFVRRPTSAPLRYFLGDRCARTVHATRLVCPPWHAWLLFRDVVRLDVPMLLLGSCVVHFVLNFVSTWFILYN
jgi:hypothetical protein